VKHKEYSKDAFCFVFVQQSKPIMVLVQPSQQITELDFSQDFRIGSNSCSELLFDSITLYNKSSCK
jgi:hypothetical protein